MKTQGYYENLTQEIGGLKTELTMSEETARIVSVRIENGELPNLDQKIIDLIREKANLIIDNDLGKPINKKQKRN